jgi:hypothetical protein
MSEAKIEIKIGEIQFSGQGEEDWIANQLDKILAQADKLIQLVPASKAGEEDPVHKPMGEDSTIAKMTLPSLLNDKGASRNQVKKFLATAVWLEAKGKNRLETSDITRALKDSNQSKLTNPADCLNQNVGKGFCEKDGKQFFVTEDGKKSL